MLSQGHGCMSDGLHHGGLCCSRLTMRPSRPIRLDWQAFSACSLAYQGQTLPYGKTGGRQVAQEDAAQLLQAMLVGTGLQIAPHLVSQA